MYRISEQTPSRGQKAVKDKGLDQLLAQATKENPLDKPDKDEHS